jgi:hypothetical protein
MEMGIEGGNAMNLIQGSLRAPRKAFELSLRQIPVARLYGSQFVKNHGRLSRERALRPSSPGAPTEIYAICAYSAKFLALNSKSVVFSRNPSKIVGASD